MERMDFGPVRYKSNTAAVIKYAITWLALSVVFFSIGYFVYCFILMSKGDINHDGKIDGNDYSIIQLNERSKIDSSAETTYVEVKAPTASTTIPTHRVHQPIVFEQ